MTKNSRKSDGASPQKANDYALIFSKQPAQSPSPVTQPDRYGVIFPLVNSCAGRNPRAKDL